MSNTFHLTSNLCDLRNLAINLFEFYPRVQDLLVLVNTTAVRRNIDANLVFFWKSWYSYQDVPTANVCWYTIPRSRLPQPQPCTREHIAATDHGFQAGSKKRVQKRLNSLCWYDILTRVEMNGRRYSITRTFICCPFCKKPFVLSVFSSVSTEVSGMWWPEKPWGYIYSSLYLCLQYLWRKHSFAATEVRRG